MAFIHFILSSSVFSLKKNHFDFFFKGLEGVNIYTRIAAGITSGGLAVIIAQPTDVVKVRLQAQGMHTSKPKRYTGAYHAYKTIFKEEGVKRGLWKGENLSDSHASCFSLSFHFVCTM